MRTSKILVLLSIAISIGGCAGPQQNQHQSVPREAHTFKPIEFKYDERRTAAANFAQQLDIPAFQCALEASNGSYAVRYRNPQGIAEYTRSLLDCNRNARSEGDAAVAVLNAAKVNPKQADLAKDLYAKWSAYLSTMSIYSRPDIRAKTQYIAAKEALAAEVKFVQ
ncbi:Uncharacterized protein ALO80_04111 [Pseudomonas caricapapayae]|uniref:Lipoprotein n=1 Tax=Pseudomonas caricapapayae TaxID=46678 RepID=A0A0P9PZS0_9PSED|nr:hypothetical protein [Pseudomonas caricapapayae]KAA8692047.1 hypothetical protein F4W67_23680 [Pseudomonas caricapapayae]KPW63076.1 Uncharacterized protein ALO80_04111 [Pseudomonas caricapapayae]RMM11454.1 hypothetical protein ALQ84_03574 [Pseudomonas caricapapayae]